MANVLVVGGAGYIGSHMCKFLASRGHTPIVLDNLSTGHRQAVRWGPFVHGSAQDSELVEATLRTHAVSAVMHFAAYCYVGESVREPARYYRNNVAATLALLEAMLRRKAPVFIFSSSCAVFGEPATMPIREDLPKAPVNPYGRTKLMVEQILSDFEAAYGLRSVSLRYFNAAGADPAGELGEDHAPETHLIPLVLQAASGRREKVQVYGTDYPTPDGTCIRDYIHIEDLAQAHLLALERLLEGSPGGAFNLGNGLGYSVKEVIEVCSRVSGREIAWEAAPRRPGDPPRLVGASELAKSELGWRPRYGDLHTIIETAWNWHRKNPQGFSHAAV